MYKACTNHLPSYLSSMVTACSSVKGRSSLRPASAGRCVVPGWRLVYGRRSFTIPGPSIWNSLPPHVCQFSHRDIFRSKLNSVALPINSNDCQASVCTSELCKKGTIKLQLYCVVIVSYCIALYCIVVYCSVLYYNDLDRVIRAHWLLSCSRRIFASDYLEKKTASYECT